MMSKPEENEPARRDRPPIPRDDKGRFKGPAERGRSVGQERRDDRREAGSPAQQGHQRG